VNHNSADPNDLITQNAKTDLATAYVNAAGQGPINSIAGGIIGVSTLSPGVYNSASSLQLNGPLTLDGGGDPNAVFVFQAATSTLVTASSSSVILTNGTQACNVYWQVGSSATLGTSSNFVGTILAHDSITDDGGSTVNGRFLAMGAAVTLNHTTISRPLCAPALGKAFSAARIVAGDNSTLTITFNNNKNSSLYTFNSAFTDALPGSMVIAGTPAVATTCGGTGALTAVPGSGSVSMASGRTISGGGSCTLSVAVTSLLVGSFTNIVSVGNTFNTASATLLVTSSPTTLPGTGFAPNRVTALPVQPVGKDYAFLGNLWLEIPRLGVQVSIVGVPAMENGWDVSWLSNQVGWLQGTAFPTWAGNSVLTGHVYDSNGNIGPFGHLSTLSYGDQIIVHAWGQQYIYEVRSMSTVAPNAVSSVIKHEELPWLTLITCKGYDEKTGLYQYRTVVKAVQVAIK